MAEDKSKPQTTPDLDSLRREIDAVDEQIHALISARAGFAQQVAIAKGDDAKAIDFFRPEREAQVLRAVVERNAGPLTDEEMVRLFREIMSACLSQQEPLKIGYLGPEGTFTQTAVHKQFGHSVRALPLPTIDEVFHEVEAGAADFGIVPIENSTAEPPPTPAQGQHEHARIGGVEKGNSCYGVGQMGMWKFRQD